MRGGAPKSPIMLTASSPARFPDPRDFDDQGLVAIGGDLSKKRLLAAYRRGIFPWYDLGYPPMWWSPDPRAILQSGDLHVSRSLQKTLNQGRFELRWNTSFERVMRACGRGRSEGTWIIPEMVKAYLRLHRAGHAHSLEVWDGEELIGGIYGVQVGGLFAAESKFHRRTDMSKVALVALVRSLTQAGIELIDVQFVTEHLGRLGAREISRVEYLQRLSKAVRPVVDLSELHPTVVAAGS